MTGYRFPEFRRESMAATGLIDLALLGATIVALWIILGV